MSKTFKKLWYKLNKTPVNAPTPSIPLEEIDGLIGNIELTMSNTNNFNDWWALHQQKQDLLLQRQLIA